MTHQHHVSSSSSSSSSSVGGFKNRGSIISLLQTSSSSSSSSSSSCKDLRPSARALHLLLINHGLEADGFLCDHLIRAIAASSSPSRGLQSRSRLLECCRQVFYKIPNPTVYSWNAVTQAHAKLGEEDTAISFYRLMHEKGLEADRCTYCCVLKACRHTFHRHHWGVLIHDQIVSVGMESDLRVASAIMDMYAKNGSIDSALNVFSTLKNPDLVAWGALMHGYLDNGYFFTVFEVYGRMQKQGKTPNQVILSYMLRACSHMGGPLQDGRLLHQLIVWNDLESDSLVMNGLVDMYCKCGSLDEALYLFLHLKCKDAVSWSVMISGYVEHGCMSYAFQLFEEMRRLGIQPSTPVVVCVLKACNRVGAIDEGRLMHDEIIKGNLEVDVAVGSSLIAVYAKCGHLLEAHNVFEHLQECDVVAWGTLIDAYSDCGRGHDALHLYKEMELKGVLPDPQIFLAMIKACASIRDIQQGMSIHGLVVKYGFISAVLFRSSLISMYGKCGVIQDAEKVFYDMEDPDEASWCAMIAGYTHLGHGILALELYLKMPVAGVKLDAVIYTCLLKACGSIGALKEGKLIHCEIFCDGYGLDTDVCDSLIDMYASCGGLEEAFKMFNGLPVRNIFSWTAIILGCVLHSNGLLALELFEKMQEQDIRADKPIYLYVARACAISGSIMEGRLLHDQILRSGLDDLDLMIKNMLVHMYAKCGNLVEACKVFSSIHCPDVVSWGILISGYAFHGDKVGAINCLEKIQNYDIKPDATLCTNIFSAYSHSGLREEGCVYFNDLRYDHGMLQSGLHYNSMIDLLSRIGYLNEAENMLHTMPVSPLIAGWTSLISSCRVYGNANMGHMCFNKGV